MTRKEIIETLHKCATGECQVCAMKDFRDCTARLKLAAASMLEDDAVDSIAEKRKAWEAHNECNPKCIHWKEDLTPDCVCNKCIGTLGSENRWARDDYYAIDTNRSEIPTSSNSSETPNGCSYSDNPNNSIRPSHYKTGAVECIEAIKASMDINEFAGFLKGNVIKYLWRYEKKGGVEDLRKAQTYLEWLIEVEQ